MIPAQLIQKKRDGHELSSEEISTFIRGLFNGEVADYQATAFLMATFFQGMCLNETLALTQAMLNSGEKYSFPRLSAPKVDKHSTGGLGDKVSLILAPLAAACGLKVPMMSGRGLGITGGTLDKLEAIPGYRIDLSQTEVEKVLSDIGCVIIGQTDKIVPADKKLYHLRDVTGTVECVPLITASILSKKIAEGSEALVMDVKVGNGAFMKTLSQARLLAKTLTRVSNKMGVPCRAILTNMDQPLGYSVGNLIEVKECIEVLQNQKNTQFSSADLKEITIQLVAHMLDLTQTTPSLTAGRKLAYQKLADGSAWRLFQSFVKSQGGNLDQAVAMPLAPQQKTITAQKPGYISKMDTAALGTVVVELGGGRKKVTDTIDHTVGLHFHKKLGASVQVGDPLITIYGKKNSFLSDLEKICYEAIEISGTRKPVPKLLIEKIGD